MEHINTEFQVAVYGDVQKVNETISKARVRIFYKYANRNGTYITDEFADKLISSISYCPIKGIYDSTEEDFTDHGHSRALGRIYGVVPENPNVTWEEHTDEDGMTRTYACADVYLFTALYKEAGEIVSKSQSMEIYAPSIKGDWKIMNGSRYYVFEEGCFLGLQVLGEEVEPCFEGAAFYSLYNDLQNAFQRLEAYVLEQENINKGEVNNMDVMNFKLSDHAKADAIWTLLNPNFSEEGNWELNCELCEVYDDYAVVYDYEHREYQRVYYTKNDENDSIELGARKKCFIIDVTEEELNALKNLHSMNGNTYEKIDENVVMAETVVSKETYENDLAEKNTQIEEYSTKISEFEQKLEECNTTVSTLTTERDAFQIQNSEFEATINSLNEEIEGLKNYKAAIEKSQKEAVLESYSEKLGDEVIESYTTKLDEYSVESLDRELAYALVKANPSMFTKNQEPKYVPAQDNLTGIEAILAKHQKKN